MKPKLIFDNERRFVDITDDRTRIKYRDVEEVEGHKFRHVKYGIFAADPAFEISKGEMYEILNRHPRVSFVIECYCNRDMTEDTAVHVVFAFTSLDHMCSEINFLNNTEDEEFTKLYRSNTRLNEITRSGFSDQVDTQYFFEPVFEQYEDHPWIKLNEHIGVQVEPGIYYFPRHGEQIGECEWGFPVVRTFDSFDGLKVAGICYGTDFHPSFDIAVEYLAIGEEHFTRLKELQSILGDGFYHEFVNDSDLRVMDRVPSQEEINAMIEASLKEIKEHEDNLVVDGDVEELVKGLGYKNICLKFERPFFESEGFREYSAAYKKDDQLVLISCTDSAYKTESHSLRFISGLYVKENVVLNDGFEYPVIHTVIRYEEERMKEILTPEAYELYLEERKKENE